MSKNIDELLSLIEEETVEKKSSKFNKDKTVEAFIADLNIEAGENKIPTYVIFYAYRKLWRDEDGFNLKKASKIAFFRSFKYPQVRDGQQRYYLLNNSVQVNEEIKKEAKLYDKKYWEKKRSNKV